VQKKKAIDNWRYDLCAGAPHTNPLLIRASDLDRDSQPILYDICLSYEKFYSKFCLYNNNYKFAQIFENNIFRDPATDARVSKQLFGIDFYDRYKGEIRRLCYNDCFSNLGFKTLLEFRNAGLPLTFAMWMRLRSCLTNFRQPVASSLTTSIESFVARWKKGGKYLRKIFSYPVINDYDYRASQCYATYIRLVSVTPSADYNIGNWAALWNICSLTNEFRTFLFKARNNCLPLNNRLHSYMPDTDPTCTFCNITKNLPAPKDSMSHCFLHCNTVINLLSMLLVSLHLNVRIDSADFEKLYWFGETDSGPDKNLANMLFFESFRFLVFRYRMRKKIPGDECFLGELSTFIKYMCMYNKKIKMAMLSTYPNTIFSQAIG
jgi:hypothetical protein